jgi:hypothetical protein
MGGIMRCTLANTSFVAADISALAESVVDFRQFFPTVSGRTYYFAISI